MMWRRKRDARYGFAWTILVAYAWALAVAPPTKAATDDVDQENVVMERGGIPITATSGATQTFTVGADGLLTRIEVQVGVLTGFVPTDDLVIDLRPAGEGFFFCQPPQFIFCQFVDPALTLFTAVIPAAELPEADPLVLTPPFPFTEIDVSAAGIEVVSGDILAIAASSSEPGEAFGGYFWERGDPIYAAGTLLTAGAGLGCIVPPNAWCIIGSDQGFRTYVPEPDPRLSAPWVLALAWILAGRRAKRGRL